MGLYLCVFDGDEELEGVEVGSYKDFAAFRDAVSERLEDGEIGRNYPTLMLHSDSDDFWSPEEARELEKELGAIAKALQGLSPMPSYGWQSEVMRQLGIRPRNLYECFVDVDGEPLIERLLELSRVAQKSGKPILFQ